MTETAFEPSDFAYTAHLLRSGDDAVTSATLSNNINIILAALDAVPHLVAQNRIWSSHYDIVKAGEDEAREQVAALSAALRDLIATADEDELGGWPNTYAFDAARAALKATVEPTSVLGSADGDSANGLKAPADTEST